MTHESFRASRLVPPVWPKCPPYSLPVYWANRVHRLRRYWKAFIQKHGFAPSDRDVQAEFDLSAEELQLFRQVLAAWYRRSGVSELVPCPRCTLVS